MKRPYLVAGLLLLAFSIAVGFESWQLRYQTQLGPGPGFFPLWLSGLLGVASLLLLARELRGAAAPLPDGFLPGRGAVSKMAIVVIALAGVILLLDHIGFRVTMLAMYLFVLYGLGRRDFVTTPLLALAGSFGVYHVFTRWLDVPLPTGAFGW